jgi:hypothetical protein
MILIAAVARQAKSQILAASSATEGLDADKLPLEEFLCPFALDCKVSSDRNNAQQPMKHISNQESPPNLVLIGASAKVSAKNANAMIGKGRLDNAGVQWDHKFYDLKL